MILLFILGRLGSQSGHFVHIFKTSIYGYYVFVDNKTHLETLNVSKFKTHLESTQTRIRCETHWVTKARNITYQQM